MKMRIGFRYLVTLLLVAFLMTVAIGCSSSYTNDQSETISPNVDQQASRKEPPDTPNEVWGDLEQNEGGMVWDTLTAGQKALVHYPRIDSQNVYWTPNGYSYHAINWCYTLSRSKTIHQGTLEEARKAGKTDPCSKCVG